MIALTSPNLMRIGVCFSLPLYQIFNGGGLWYLGQKLLGLNSSVVVVKLFVNIIVTKSNSGPAILYMQLIQKEGKGKMKMDKNIFQKRGNLSFRYCFRKH